MTDTANPPAGSTAPPADGTPPAGTTTPPADGSLLDGVSPPPAGDTPPAGDATKPFGERVPEKYRVTKDDGSLDIEATAAKVEDARAALERKLGSGERAPDSPDGYTFESPKDADGKPILDEQALADFVADPLFKNFAKDAHAQGFTNAQLQFAVERYLSKVPELIAADQQLSLDEARSTLAKVWTDDATMQKNLTGVVRAINAFGSQDPEAPGSVKTLMEKYGRDPDFIAFAAKVSGELPEDRPPSGALGGSDGDIEALQKSEAYWKPEHPDHTKVKALVQAHYERKYGKKPR